MEEFILVPTREDPREVANMKAELTENVALTDAASLGAKTTSPTRSHLDTALGPSKSKPTPTPATATTTAAPKRKPAPPPKPKQLLKDLITFGDSDDDDEEPFPPQPPPLLSPQPGPSWRDPSPFPFHNEDLAEAIKKFKKTPQGKGKGKSPLVRERLRKAVRNQNSFNGQANKPSNGNAAENLQLTQKSFKKRFHQKKVSRTRHAGASICLRNNKM